MKKLLWPIIIAMTACGFVALMWLLVSGSRPDVLYPTGSIAEQQQAVLLFATLLSAVIVVPVFIMLVAFAWRYRQSNQNASYQPEWSKNKWLETAWWGIPILLICVLASVTWVTTHSLDPYQKIDSPKSPLKIQVVALQWKWLFIYPEEGIATINTMPIERDRTVELALSADAPMSSFWVPSLGSQIYSMNGMNTKLHLLAKKDGVYDGYNTNINGEGYADMKFTVKVQSAATFNAWAKQVRGSSMKLDMHHYAILAKPSRNEPVHQMQLADNDLYNQIVMKYMHPTHATKTPTQSGAIDMKHEGMAD